MRITYVLHHLYFSERKKENIVNVGNENDTKGNLFAVVEKKICWLNFLGNDLALSEANFYAHV